MTRARGTETLALVVSVCVLGLAACFDSPPCSAGDVTPGGVAFAHGAECAARVQKCGNDGECKALVREDCNRWYDQRCGFAGGPAVLP